MSGCNETCSCGRRPSRTRCRARKGRPRPRQNRFGPLLLLPGRKTILVVEDDPLVRDYVIAQLGGLGYKTLIASEAEAALALVDHGAAFDLLFTDMVMPGGMNGRELAEAVRKRRPGVKVLYTSGYTDEFVHEGRLDSSIALLRKPYRKADLSQKIREVLAAR
jgi:CheY-like chemotaxis protein